MVNQRKETLYQSFETKDLLIAVLFLLKFVFLFKMVCLGNWILHTLYFFFLKKKNS